MKVKPVNMDTLRRQRIVAYNYGDCVRFMIDREQFTIPISEDGETRELIHSPLGDIYAVVWIGVYDASVFLSLYKPNNKGKPTNIPIDIETRYV